MNIKRKHIVVALTFVVIASFSVLAALIVKKNHHYWLPAFFETYLQGVSPFQLQDKITDVMVVIADHHEVKIKDKTNASTKKWLDQYLQVTEGISDSFGNPVQYSWFYPYDHKNSYSVIELNKAVYAGRGEIEFHWHHSHPDSASFEQELKEAVDWFGAHGAMVEEHGGPSRFAFIHGNWSLDNARGERYCGVDNEIELLSRYGGYMDMTFYCCSEAQPSMAASLYYVKDDPEPKSYDVGEPVELGRENDDFLIFTGPLGFNWSELKFEYGSLEAWDSRNWKKRIPLWVNGSPYIEGKPEWRFLKLYTHGAQSSDLILDEDFRTMLTEVKRYTESEEINLHYVTAREAYNILKAAEAEKVGTPQEFKDFKVPKPLNRKVLISQPVY